MYLRCKARASLQVRARLLADDVGRAAARRLQPTARDHLGSELSTVVNSDTPPIDRRGPRSTTPGGRNGARWTANLHRESNASQHERLDLVPCSGTLARHRRRSVACAAERRSPVSQVRSYERMFDRKGLVHGYDLSLVFRLVREWYVRDGLEDDLAVGVDRGWEGLGRAVDRDGRGAQGA